MILREELYMLPSKLDVIVVNYNAGETLRLCVESILASKGVSVRCIVVDNASVDGSADFCQQYASDALVLLRNTQNLGFSCAVNQGVALSDGAWLMLLNPDVIVPADSLCQLLNVAQSAAERVAALGCVVRNPDGSEQRGCRRDIPTPAKALAHAVGLQRVFPVLQFNHTDRPLPATPQAVAAISGSCMLLRRTAYDEIGGFDERYFLHFEDLDYCVRLQRKNWLTLFVPSVEIEHAQGVSSARAPVRVVVCKHVSMLRFFSQHAGLQKFLLPILAPLVLLRVLAQIGSIYYKKVF